MAIKIDLTDPGCRREADLPYNLTDHPNGLAGDQAERLRGDSRSQKLLSEFSKWQKSPSLQLDPGPWNIEDSELDRWNPLGADRIAGYLVFGITADEFTLTRSIAGTILVPYNIASVLRCMEQSGMPRDRFADAMEMVWKVRRDLVDRDIPRGSSKVDTTHYLRVAAMAIPAMARLSARLSGDGLYRACYLHCWSVILGRPNEDESMRLILKVLDSLGDDVARTGALADIVASAPYLAGTDVEIDNILAKMGDPHRASVISRLILHSPGDTIEASVVSHYLELIDKGVPADWASLALYSF